jgi:fatty acid desaturase
MENNVNQIESLLERAVDYGKTSYELLKLKTLDKTSDVASSMIPNIIVFFVFVTFLLFLNLGLAFWLGEILGKLYYGFFIIAAFYFIIGIVLHFFMHKWIKKNVGNYIVKRMLK